MLKQRRNDVSGSPIGILFCTAQTSSGELFQFTKGDLHRVCMSGNDAFVSRDERCNGNRLWRRKGEIVEHAPQAIASLREELASLRMLIFTKRQKCIRRDCAGQLKLGCTLAKPFP